MALSSNQKRLLQVYLIGDRQWKRYWRIGHAKRMLKLAGSGIYWKGSSAYDKTFWNAVLEANDASA